MSQVSPGVNGKSRASRAGGGEGAVGLLLAGERYVVHAVRRSILDDLDDLQDRGGEDGVGIRGVPAAVREDEVEVVPPPVPNLQGDDVRGVRGGGRGCRGRRPRPGGGGEGEQKEDGGKASHGNRSDVAAPSSYLFWCDVTDPVGGRVNSGSRV